MDGGRDIWELVTEGDEWFWEQIITLKGKDKNTGQSQAGRSKSRQTQITRTRASSRKKFRRKHDQLQESTKTWRLLCSLSKSKQVTAIYGSLTAREVSCVLCCAERGARGPQPLPSGSLQSSWGHLQNSSDAPLWQSYDGGNAGALGHLAGTPVLLAPVWILGSFCPGLPLLGLPSHSRDLLQIPQSCSHLSEFWGVSVLVHPPPPVSGLPCLSHDLPLCPLQSQTTLLIQVTACCSLFCLAVFIYITFTPQFIIRVAAPVLSLPIKLRSFILTTWPCLPFSWADWGHPVRTPSSLEPLPPAKTLLHLIISALLLIPFSFLLT